MLAVIIMIIMIVLSVVIFGFETTEYFVSENDGVLAVNILKFTQTTQVSSVRFITRDVQVGESFPFVPGRYTCK